MAELLEGFASEHLEVAKITHQLSLELLPVVNVEEWALFVKRHVLEKKLDFS